MNSLLIANDTTITFHK